MKIWRQHYYKLLGNIPKIKNLQYWWWSVSEDKQVYPLAGRIGAWWVWSCSVYFPRWWFSRPLLPFPELTSQWILHYVTRHVHTDTGNSYPTGIGAYVLNQMSKCISYIIHTGYQTDSIFVRKYVFVTFRLNLEISRVKAVDTMEWWRCDGSNPSGIYWVLLPGTFVNNLKCCSSKVVESECLGTQRWTHISQLSC